MFAFTRAFDMIEMYAVRLLRGYGGRASAPMSGRARGDAYEYIVEFEP